MQTTPPPEPLSEHIRLKLSRQPAKDTKPEVSLRRILHSRGRRFRVGYPVPGLPRRSIDIAFPRAKLAVMVDGCFWHGCPVHGHTPKNNSGWWEEKIARNKARDDSTTASLSTQGWQVLRIWEHVPPDAAADLVESALARLGARPQLG